MPGAPGLASENWDTTIQRLPTNPYLGAASPESASAYANTDITAAFSFKCRVPQVSLLRPGIPRSSAFPPTPYLGAASPESASAYANTDITAAFSFKCCASTLSNVSAAVW